MDWNSIITIVAFVALFALVIIWRHTKGKRGEKQVAALLALLPKNDYKVINNLLIKSGEHSTQIDYIIRSMTTQPYDWKSGLSLQSLRIPVNTSPYFVIWPSSSNSHA